MRRHARKRPSTRGGQRRCSLLALPTPRYRLIEAPVRIHAPRTRGTGRAPRAAARPRCSSRSSLEVEDGQVVERRGVLVDPARAFEEAAALAAPAPGGQVDRTREDAGVEHRRDERGVAEHEGVVNLLARRVLGVVGPERPHHRLPRRRRLRRERLQLRHARVSDAEGAEARARRSRVVSPRRDRELDGGQQCVSETPPDKELLARQLAKEEGASAAASRPTTAPACIGRISTTEGCVVVVAAIVWDALRHARAVGSSGLVPLRRLAVVGVGVAAHHVGQHERVAEHAHLQRRRDQRAQPVVHAPTRVLVELAHPDADVVRTVGRAHLACGAEARRQLAPQPRVLVGRRHRAARHELRLARVELEAVDANLRHQPAQPPDEPCARVGRAHVEERALALPPRHDRRRAVGPLEPVAQPRALCEGCRVGLGKRDDPDRHAEACRVQPLHHGGGRGELDRVKGEVAVRAAPPVVNLEVRARVAVAHNL
mmetsp:Transcript_10931/g.23547  ORF Transcript_10931/g.23547 Transcript_10931/m.23547 type:complete len:485 (+) Transcript_10931:136-1590(+)